MSSEDDGLAGSRASSASRHPRRSRNSLALRSPSSARGAAWVAAVGDVFCHLRIDNGLDFAYAWQYRRIVLDRGSPTAGGDAGSSKQDLVGSLEILLYVHDLLQPICFMEDRSGGEIQLTREIFKLSEALSIASKGLLLKASEKSSKERRPQALIRLVMGKLESSFWTISRPVLHAAARVVHEMGKSRSTAYYFGAYDEGANLQAYSDNVES